MTANERRRKPAELRVLHGAAADLFSVLRENFGVAPVHSLALYDVDGGNGRPDGPCEWNDTRTVAAIAMVEAQALRHAARADCVVNSAEVIRIATTLHHAIERLATEQPDGSGTPLLLRTRDRINTAARVVAHLGSGVYGGVVDLD